MKKLILASGSPRRKEILRGLGLKFDIMPSHIEEKVIEGISPENLAVSLALQKAEEVAGKLEYPALVIGADTIVVLKGQIMGKPEGNQQAFEMLKKLTGKTHTVITGIAMVERVSGICLADFQTTTVKMKAVTSERLWKYVRTGEPLDKAGGYAVQGKASIFVEKIDGCFFNVMGLPVTKLDEMLSSFGIDLFA